MLFHVLKLVLVKIKEDVQQSHNNGVFGPTCEEAAVVLLYFLRRFKLLLGMFL